MGLKHYVRRRKTTRNRVLRYVHVDEGNQHGGGKASPQGRGPYLFKEEIRPKEGPNFHHQGVIMICDITSDSNTFDYFLEEALVKRSVEPAEIALLKTSPLNSLIGVKPANHRAKQGK